MPTPGSRAARICAPATRSTNAWSSERGASTMSSRAPSSTRATPFSPSASTCVQASSTPWARAASCMSLNLRSSTMVLLINATLSAAAAGAASAQHRAATIHIHRCISGLR
jgi:hypothetical protein